ncbi:hypothetical protein T10_10928 [Trichinella papuae]|uniref:Uncharacterized protein n=1 Tax=Trichinella papuae TaxID=268474 RepID=A0A0V1N9L3_9BILA|nr:hypothetical protein T10_10928 [Trichinella papuae]
MDINITECSAAPEVYIYSKKFRLYLMQRQNQKLVSEAKVVLAWDRTRDHLRVKQM